MRCILVMGLCLVSRWLTAQDIRGTEKLTLTEALNTMNRYYSQNTEPREIKKLMTDLKSEWFIWLYKIQKYQTLLAYLHSINDLQRIAELQSRAGEISILDKSDLITKLAEAETSVYTEENEIIISRNRIQQLIQKFNDFVPADTGLSLYMIDKSCLTADILMDTALLQSRNKEIENRQLRLDNLFMKLQLLSQYKIPYAETLIATALARYKSEDIDYIELVNHLSVALSIKTQYLDILNEYNQSAIQLEYYAY